MAEPSPSAPPVLAGYSYVRPLGSGGFSTVFLYAQDMPRRQVAVKVLNHRLTTADERIEFAAEADAMAKLSNHPAIVSMYSAGIAADGRPYFAMEFCPGSMREHTRGKPAPLAQVLDVGVRLAGALESAHRAGVLHRDIKPSNVLIALTGRPTLADFGIAMLTGRATTNAVSEAASIPWAAPEVLGNQTLGTPATEVWSLAATLYTFAAGRSPFESTDRAENTHAGMRARVARAKYTPVPGAQGYAAFDALLAKAMAKNPQDRFASMDQFAGAIQQVQRSYGFDVTPFDMHREVWAEPMMPQAANMASAQNSTEQNNTAQNSTQPVAAAMTTRAAARVAAQAAAAVTQQAGQRARRDRDELLPGRHLSVAKATVIGVASAVAVLAAVAVVGVFAGWW